VKRAITGMERTMQVIFLLVSTELLEGDLTLLEGI
jgi:hypothetical protein